MSSVLNGIWCRYKRAAGDGRKEVVVWSKGISFKNLDCWKVFQPSLNPAGWVWTWFASDQFERSAAGWGEQTLSNNAMISKVVKDDPLTLFTWEDEQGGKRRKRDTEEELSSKVGFNQNWPQHCQSLHVLFQHCDKTAAVDANGTKIVLCLNRSRLKKKYISQLNCAFFSEWILQMRTRWSGLFWLNESGFEHSANLQKLRELDSDCIWWEHH